MQSERAGFLILNKYLRYLKLCMDWLQTITLLGILGSLYLHLKLIWKHISDFGVQEEGALLLGRIF